MGSIVRRYGPRLHGVALFGPAARGDIDPGSDIDLFVLLDRHEEDVREDVEESVRLGRAVLALGGEEAAGDHHDPNPMTADPRAFRTPGRIMLGVVSDAIVVYDPRGDVGKGFAELRDLRRRSHAKEYRSTTAAPVGTPGRSSGRGVA